MNLFKKYFTNRLTPANLQQLRRQTDSMTDSEIEDELHRLWLQSAPMPAAASPRRRYIFAGIAAAVACVLVVGALFLFHTPHSEQGLLCVQTGADEMCTLSLPDGTRVVLNANSSLSYAADDFTSRSRALTLDGEAYFDVQTNPKAPFVITTPSIEVEVLGTAFNLCSRGDATSDMLFLERGKVSFRVSDTGADYIVSPQQKITHNRTTGEVSLRHSDMPDCAPWRKGLMAFDATPLRDVMAELADQYGVHISYTSISDEPFTGTLPANDINEALRILSLCYNIKITSTADTLILSSK